MKTLNSTKFGWIFSLPKASDFNIEARFKVFHRDKRLFPKGNTLGFEWLFLKAMWLLHCLLIIIHGKKECFLSPFLVTVISTYTSLWKSTEKSLSYTVHSSHPGVRCSCYIWKITITLIETFKCKNMYTTCMIFKLGISDIPSLSELYNLTIVPQSSMEKRFSFFCFVYPEQHNPCLQDGNGSKSMLFSFRRKPWFLTLFCNLGPTREQSDLGLFCPQQTLFSFHHFFTNAHRRVQGSQAH